MLNIPAWAIVVLAIIANIIIYISAPSVECDHNHQELMKTRGQVNVGRKQSVTSYLDCDHPDYCLHDD